MNVPCPRCGKEITIPSEAAWLRAVNDVLREKLQAIVEGRNNPGETRLAIQQVLRDTGYQPEPGAEGSEEDFGQSERQNLVIETNVDTARGYTQVIMQNQPEALESFPALELVMGGWREHHRGDPCYPPGSVGSIGWEIRWQEAAEKSDDEGALKAFRKTGRMVALKSSGVWKQLGTLWADSIGNPYPPFAWDSSYTTEEVAREDAEELGLIGTEDEAQSQCGLRPPKFIRMEDARMTEWLRNQLEECGHCGEAKPRTILTVCDDCEETICPDCKARGCTGPFQPEPAEPRNAFDCFNQALNETAGELPLKREAAERVLQWCDRAFEFGFASKYHYAISRTHRLRGEALESLGQKEQALREFELAVEQDPKLGLKRRIASLRKECGKE
jgi:hypothetical protein